MNSRLSRLRKAKKGGNVSHSRPVLPPKKSLVGLNLRKPINLPPKRNVAPPRPVSFSTASQLPIDLDLKGKIIIESSESLNWVNDFSFPYTSEDISYNLMQQRTPSDSNVESSSAHQKRFLKSTLSYTYPSRERLARWIHDKMVHGVAIKESINPLSKNISAHTRYEWLDVFSSAIQAWRSDKYSDFCVIYKNQAILFAKIRSGSSKMPPTETVFISSSILQMRKDMMLDYEFDLEDEYSFKMEMPMVDDDRLKKEFNDLKGNSKKSHSAIDDKSPSMIVVEEPSNIDYVINRLKKLTGPRFTKYEQDIPMIVCPSSFHPLEHTSPSDYYLEKDSQLVLEGIFLPSTMRAILENISSAQWIKTCESGSSLAKYQIIIQPANVLQHSVFSEAITKLQRKNKIKGDDFLMMESYISRTNSAGTPMFKFNVKERRIMKSKL
eukprot:TRINITY_DN322220_c0_g1_i1.p1 TRINITY_DN322220_c0_g1~~TRINITY_DN322220_c0_g1_i1.p1  ORF type:complete len:438 (-),score=81.86 TRINITY_DN322220_c0_g1_i1:76-1389(-)